MGRSTSCSYGSEGPAQEGQHMAAIQNAEPQDDRRGGDQFGGARRVVTGSDGPRLVAQT